VSQCEAVPLDGVYMTLYNPLFSSRVLEYLISLHVYENNQDSYNTNAL